MNEVVLKRGRGRPKKNSIAPIELTLGRDPRLHIQVIAGVAVAGRNIDFVHNDGQVSKITPSFGRKLIEFLNNLKPVDRQKAVNDIHDNIAVLESHR